MRKRRVEHTVSEGAFCNPSKIHKNSIERKKHEMQKKCPPPPPNFPERWGALQYIPSRAFGAAGDKNMSKAPVTLWSPWWNIVTLVEYCHPSGILSSICKYCCMVNIVINMMRVDTKEIHYK